MHAKFQRHPPYGFWEEDFLHFLFYFILFFSKFSLSVAMATNQISDLDKIHMVGRGVLQKTYR